MQEVPFEAITVPHDGKHRTAFKIQCCKCHKTLVAIRPTHLRHAKRVEIENKLVDKALTEAGWTFKKGFRRCTCPDHIPETDYIPEENEEVAITKDVAQAELAQGKTSDGFRQPDLRQRRQILEDLDMVYDIDKGCYKKGHSDDSIAKARNFPRKWVKDLRELLFGLNEKSEDFAEVLASLKNFKTALEGSEARMFAELEKVQGIMGEVQKVIDNLQK